MPSFEWPATWELHKVGNKVLDCKNSQYGDVDDKAISWYKANGRARTALDKIETITNDPESRTATVTLKDGTSFDCEGTPEGEPTARDEYTISTPLEPSNDMIHDTWRILDALGLSRYCYEETLSGKTFVDLDGLIGKGGVVTPDKAVPYLREFIAQNVGLIGGKIRPSREGILEAIDRSVNETEPRNAFLDAMGKPPQEMTRYQGYELLRRCGASVPCLKGRPEDEARYLDNVLKSQMLAIVERQHWPTKVDACMVLIGPQGTGKSTFCQVLGGGFLMPGSTGWYKQTVEGVGTEKKLMESASGGIVLEMPEGGQLEDVKGIKAYLDKPSMQYRKSYRHDEESIDIRFITIITTNDDRPLIDPTGGRRFMPVWMTGDAEGAVKPWDISPDEIRGLYHQAIRDFEAGERWRDAFDLIKDLLPEIQAAASSVPFIEEIEEAFEIAEADKEIPHLESGDNAKLTVVNDALRYGLEQQRLSGSEISKALESFKRHPENYGYERRRTTCRIDGVPCKAYSKLRRHRRRAQTGASSPSSTSGLDPFEALLLNPELM